MDDIKRLQQQLQNAIQQDSTQKLSDKNMVELVSKLRSSGKLPLLFTLDGKEYLTPEQLEREIQDEIVVHNGRVNLTELQALLNVDLCHIQEKADAIVHLNGKIDLVGGELITSEYLDGVVEEVGECLHETGLVELTDIAGQFGLPVDLITASVERRMGKSVHGKLEGGTLYTPAYVSRQAARARGTLSGVTRPTGVGDLITTSGVTNEAMFMATMDELLSSGRLVGSMKGRRGMFTPKVFARMRDRYVDAFFQQNSYIEYDVVAKFQMATPQQYLTTRFPKGIALASCFIHPSVVDGVDAAAEEALRTDAWLNIMTLLPSPMTASDAEETLRACPSLAAKKGKAKGPEVVMAQHYVVSPGFVTDCTNRLEARLQQQAADGSLQAMVAKQHDAAVKAAVGGKGGKGKQAAVAEDDSDDEGKGGKKRGKGAKGKAAKGKAAAEPSRSAEPAAVSLSVEEVSTLLTTWLPPLADEPNLLEELASLLRPRTAAMIDKCLRAVFKDTSSAAPGERKEKEGAVHPVVERLQSVLVFMKGVAFVEGMPDASIPGKASTVTALNQHLMKTLCTDLVSAVVADQAEHQLALTEPIATAKDRDKVIARMPGDVAEALNALVTALKGSPNDFVDALCDQSGVFGLRLTRKLDKKEEKRLLAANVEAMEAQLRAETDSASAFHVMVVLLFARGHQALLHAPGKCVTALLHGLEAAMDGDMYASLTAYHALVFQWLKTKGQGPEAAAIAEQLAAGLADGGLRDRVLAWRPAS